MAMFQPEINAATAQSLRDIVGGGTAMQYISEQNDMRRRMNPINENLSLADLEKATLANAQSRLTNPLDVQIKGAAAREANSKGDDYFNTVNSGVMSDARSKVATEKSGIALKNTENSAKQRQILGDELIKRAAWMAEAVPPAEYSAALQQFAQAIPGMTERPEFQALIKQPPDKILAFMQKMGDTLRAGDPALRNAAEIHREDNISKEKVAAGNNSATRYSADAAAAAKKKDVVQEARTLYMKGQPQGALILSDLAREAGDMRAAADWEKKAKDLAARIRGDKAAGALVGDDRTRQIMNMPRNSDGDSSGQPVRTWNPNTRRWE